LKQLDRVAPSGFKAFPRQAAINSLLTRQTTEINFNQLEQIADISMDEPQPLPTELSVGAIRAKLDQLQQGLQQASQSHTADLSIN
jgi:hypothetical protein